MSPVAGLDIGGSKVHAVIVDPARPSLVLGEHRLPTRPGADGVLASALEALGEAAARAGTTAADLAGIGVGVPGLVDRRAGDVAHAVNLGLGAGVLSLRERLETVTGVAVTVENDVNAAALGAAAVLGGPEPGRPADLAYLSVGTGLAAGLVLDGRLRRGAQGAAGEIGHVPLDPSGPLCPCGQRGCLEVLASGRAIARAWPTADGVHPARALFDAADAGQPAAVQACSRVTGHLAVAVRLLVCTVDVATVVLGGGVAELGERLADRVRDHLAQAAASSPFLAALDLPARVALAPAGVPVAAIGAALAALQPLAALHPVPDPPSGADSAAGPADLMEA